MEIVEFDDAPLVGGGERKVVKTVECRSERDAERVDGGMNINLNHEMYFTRIRNRAVNATGDK